MNLIETNEEVAFRNDVRTFAADNLPADIRRRVLNFMHLPREDYVRWQLILQAKGWGAPAWPREHGGTGWSAWQRMVFEAECFTAGAPRQIPFGLSMLAPVLMKFGSPAQRARYLPRILSLEDWWCQGYSEPNAGSDLAALSTRAERRGDSYVVTGQKIWTTFAQWANWLFCLVRTSSEAKPQAGISFLLVPMNSPGLKVRPIHTLDLGADVNEVFLDEVVVPVENLVGAEGGGWTIAKYLLGHERTASASIGLCKRLLKCVKELAGRSIKGGSAMIDNGRFKDQVVQLEMELLSHEWSLMRVISLEASGVTLGVEPSILKIRGSEIQQALSHLLLECAGPYGLPFVARGLDDGSDAECAAGADLNSLAAQYFDMRKVSIFAGTTEVQKNIIAKATLGL